MTDETARICVEIFRGTTGLDVSSKGVELSDENILTRPIDSFEIDSLETMEFVMAVEDRFGILLNEESVNGCKTLADFVKLVVDTRDV